MGKGKGSAGGSGSAGGVGGGGVDEVRWGGLSFSLHPVPHARVFFSFVAVALVWWGGVGCPFR